MSDRTEPIDREQFETQQLAVEHPPRLQHANKKIVYEIACPPGSARRGKLEYTRWAAMALPESVDTRSAPGRSADRPGFYDYTPVGDRGGAVEWHVNFADRNLFFAYGSGLFAQDELQVAEHPALGSLREALSARQLHALTVEDGRPTPVLVMGAERRCRVATEPNANEGRPYGLYGNAFARGEADAVRRATTRVDPPTITHVIAMAAPAGGRGRYRTDEIEHVLVTAFTAFHAAVLESVRARGAGTPVVVHTGFWGCGAFGGHRVLITTIQVLAAEMAGVSQIVFHTGDPTGAAAIGDARRFIAEKLFDGSPLAVGELLERIEAAGYEWGVSDGN
jgi:Poly (ADP-ribose) glycohydrolase (PARG)